MPLKTVKEPHRFTGWFLTDIMLQSNLLSCPVIWGNFVIMAATLPENLEGPPLPLGLAQWVH